MSGTTRFEWRYVAAGLGWGVAVGVATGVLLTWFVLAAAAASQEPASAPSLSTVSGFLAGALSFAVYGAMLGLIPGSAAGFVIGCVLSVLVGRQGDARRAALETSLLTLVLVPILGYFRLALMDWTIKDLDDPWFWLTLGLPTLLGVPAMRWSAVRIARLNASRAANPDQPVSPATGAGPPGPAR